MNDVLSITLVGIVIVFIVLAILSIFFILFKYFSPERKSTLKKEINIPHTDPKPEETINKNMNLIEEDDTEIVAAIIGAISASTKSKNFRIKSVTPTSIPKNKKLTMWGMLSPTVTWRVKKIGGRK